MAIRFPRRLISFERFSEYVKLMVAAGVCTHFVINLIVIEFVFQRPDLARDPLPVALPIGLIGAAYGWWVIYNSPQPIIYRTEYSECPCCKQQIAKRIRVDNIV